jgi:Rha family phage regulatory protein
MTRLNWQMPGRKVRVLSFPIQGGSSGCRPFLLESQMDKFPVLNFVDFIAVDGDHLVTDSLKVASVFGKRHDNVLRIIRSLGENLPSDFNALNFEAVTYIDEKGQSRVSYRLTRDGFSLIAMRFTGKKALSFQVAYIGAFNAMAAYIKNQREGLQYQYFRKELELKHKAEKVSESARDMRRWQDDKPKLTSDMQVLLDQMQPTLLPN